MWVQKTIRLKSRPRGFHIITSEITGQFSEIGKVRTGLLHLFLQHTSASLTLNENVCPEVRDDFESHMNRVVPENAPYYEHTMEGADDMPAHIKSSLFGCSLTVPISGGKLMLGTWQGIYLNEHRNHGGSRSVVLTLWGE